MLTVEDPGPPMVVIVSTSFIPVSLPGKLHKEELIRQQISNSLSK